MPSVQRGWRPGVAERLGFYVYLLSDPRDGGVFYVGKGAGNRCFAHLVEARKTMADSTKEFRKLARIREIEAAGHDVRTEILRRGLDEPTAYIAESAVIEATRKWWRVGASRRRQGTAGAPDYAFSVYGGVVRAVYRIDGREPPAPELIEEDPRRSGRWGFRGSPASELEDRYLLANVTEWLPAAAQNAIRYVNCAGDSRGS